MTKFQEWFNGLVGFTLTSERFISECQHMDVSDKNIKRLIEWLEAAYQSGFEEAQRIYNPD